jgi:hypothetical protein
VACRPGADPPEGTKLRHRGARPKGDAMWIPRAGYNFIPADLMPVHAEHGCRARKPLSAAVCRDRRGRALAGSFVRAH